MSKNITEKKAPQKIKVGGVVYEKLPEKIRVKGKVYVLDTESMKTAAKKSSKKPG